MRVITPAELANTTGSKYLGVLVAAKYARSLNEFRRGEMQAEEVDTAVPPREKLTTTALAAVARGDVDFDLADRRRNEPAL